MCKQKGRSYNRSTRICGSEGSERSDQVVDRVSSQVTYSLSNNPTPTCFCPDTTCNSLISLYSLSFLLSRNNCFTLSIHNTLIPPSFKPKEPNLSYSHPPGLTFLSDPSLTSSEVKFLFQKVLGSKSSPVGSQPPSPPSTPRAPHNQGL